MHQAHPEHIGHQRNRLIGKGYGWTGTATRRQAAPAACGACRGTMKTAAYEISDHAWSERLLQRFNPTLAKL